VVWSIGKRPKGIINTNTAHFSDVFVPTLMTEHNPGGTKGHTSMKCCLNSQLFIYSSMLTDGFPAKPKPIVTFAIPTQQQLGIQQDGAVQTSHNAAITRTTTNDTAATTNGQEQPSDVSTTPATPAASAKPMSWAERARPKHPIAPASAVVSNGTTVQKPVEANKATVVNGAKFDGIADVLHKYQTTYSSVLIQPRGLVNNGNMCFMNAVSLVHVSKALSNYMVTIRNDALTLI
jgi:hypothetical protein